MTADQLSNDIMRQSLLDARNDSILLLVRKITSNTTNSSTSRYRVLFERLEQAGEEISDLRDLLDLQLDTIAHQAMLLAARDKEIAALREIIRVDIPASVADEMHPLSWHPTAAENAEWLRQVAPGHHCACECGCTRPVDKPNTLCRTCLPF